MGYPAQSHATTRYHSLFEAPDAVLRCWAFGHRWDPGPVLDEPGWGARVWRVVARCDCGRVREDVLAPRSGALLSRHYGGGAGLSARVSVERADARKEWARRDRARRAGGPLRLAATG